MGGGSSHTREAIAGILLLLLFGMLRLYNAAETEASIESKKEGIDSAVVLEASNATANNNNNNNEAMLQDSSGNITVTSSPIIEESAGEKMLRGASKPSSEASAVSTPSPTSDDTSAGKPNGEA